jgi:hypothetical protein
MIEQVSFDFTARPDPAEIGDVERLLTWLSARPGFHTAATISAALDLSDRKVRQLAESSDGLIVSGPGSPGYCHLYHCPAEKIHHITATQLSQAKLMIRRALRTRRRAHSIVAGASGSRN